MEYHELFDLYKLADDVHEIVCALGDHVSRVSLKKKEFDMVMDCFEKVKFILESVDEKN